MCIQLLLQSKYPLLQIQWYRPYKEPNNKHEHHYVINIILLIGSEKLLSKNRKSTRRTYLPQLVQSPLHIARESACASGGSFQIYSKGKQQKNIDNLGKRRYHPPHSSRLPKITKPSLFTFTLLDLSLLSYPKYHILSSLFSNSQVGLPLPIAIIFTLCSFVSNT